MPKVLFGKTPDKKKPPEHCYVWANKLYDIDKEARASYTPHSRTKWATEFLMLEKALQTSQPPAIRIRLTKSGIPPLGGYTKICSVIERIEKALKWYAKNVKGVYTPRCDSAVSFRKKFRRIEDAMKRSIDTSLEMTETGEFFTKRIGRFWWPELSKKQLPYVIQASVNAILTFRLKAWKYMAMNGLDDRKRPDEEDKLRMFVRHKVLNYITYENLIEVPLEKVFHRNHDKLGWDGDLTREIVDTESDKFREFGRTYCGSAKLWDEFYTDMEESV